MLSRKGFYRRYFVWSSPPTLHGTKSPSVWGSLGWRTVWSDILPDQSIWFGLWHKLGVEVRGTRRGGTAWHLAKMNPPSLPATRVSNWQSIESCCVRSKLFMRHRQGDLRSRTTHCAACMRQGLCLRGPAGPGVKGLGVLPANSTRESHRDQERAPVDPKPRSRGRGVSWSVRSPHAVAEPTGTANSQGDPRLWIPAGLPLPQATPLPPVPASRRPAPSACVSPSPASSDIPAPSCPMWSWSACPLSVLVLLPGLLRCVFSVALPPCRPWGSPRGRPRAARTARVPPRAQPSGPAKKNSRACGSRLSWRTRRAPGQVSPGRQAQDQEHRLARRPPCARHNLSFLQLSGHLGSVASLWFAENWGSGLLCTSLLWTIVDSEGAPTCLIGTVSCYNTFISLAQAASLC